MKGGTPGSCPLSEGVWQGDAPAWRSSFLGYLPLLALPAVGASF